MSEEVINRFMQSSGAGDIDVAVECFADDGKWITADGGGIGTVYARGEVGDLMKNLNATREKLIATGVDAKFEPPIMLREDLGLLRWTVERSDGTVVNRGVDIFVLQDGKIVLKDVYRKV